MAETAVLDRLRLSDHACVIVDDDEARLSALTAYVRAGLRDNDRIVYFGPAPDRVADDLAGAGLGSAAARDRDQLILVTPEESYLASGSFDPEATMAGWRSEAARAQAAGYRGLRAIGDMSWAARPVPGGDRLAWYEAQVNRVFADGAAMAMCLYDRRLFDPSELRRLCWAHPAVVDHDLRPGLRATRSHRPPGLRLEGEAGLGNRHALRAVMEHLVEDAPPGDGPLTVDISGLRLADDAAVRILMQTAVTEASRLRIVGCSPAVQRLLAFNGADAVTGPGDEPA